MGRKGTKHRPTRRKRPLDAQGAGADSRFVSKQGDTEEACRKCDAFEEYYKLQGIVPQDQWPDFMQSLRTDLPVTFRFVAGRKDSAKLLEEFKEKIVKPLAGQICEDGTPCSISTLDWYPGCLAFQVNMKRKSIKRHPQLRLLHKFLIAETACGIISRQEAVSMIPPLFMDVKPNHAVFDMCAAPGSKTAQIIDMLHSDQTTSIPTGMILANDADSKRSYMLVHQTLKRSGSPCCIVSCMDAKTMPNMKITDESGDLVSLKFDRILCDVPCSGDGTLRKNVELWRTWKLSHAYGLHRLQLKIAERGLQLLKVGGLMVYSTCSLNPIEDEAVVCALLQQSKGTLELCDMTCVLPSLVRCNGIRSWKVIDDDDERIYENFEAVPENLQRKLPETVFPPTTESAERIHLERCMRFLPHHQDTGGFFVAVLKKIADKRPASSVGSVNCGQTESLPLKKPKFIGRLEDPFILLPKSDATMTSIRDYFGFSQAFDDFSLLVRSSSECKKSNIYLVNDLVKNFLVNNEDKVKMVNAGLRVFGKASAKLGECHFRLAQEGVDVLYPLLTKRTICISPSDMITLLKSGSSCLLSAFSEECRPILADMPNGSVLLSCSSDGLDIRIVAWRSKASLSPYVDKETRMHFLHLLGQLNWTSEADVEEKLDGSPRQGQGSDVVEPIVDPMFDP